MIFFSFMLFVLLLLGTLLIFVTRCLVLVTGCTCVIFHLSGATFAICELMSLKLRHTYSILQYTIGLLVTSEEVNLQITVQCTLYVIYLIASFVGNISAKYY